MPTNISHSQLAEGARLLEAVKHAQSMLRPDEFSREADESAQHLSDWMWQNIESLIGCASRAVRIEAWLRDLAARHNIDLSEPTPNPTGDHK